MRVIAGLSLALLTVVASHATPAGGHGPVQAIATGELAAISGVVRDATSQEPIAGAVVFLGNTNGFGSDVREVTDASGRYVFTRLHPDTAYFVQASRVGYLSGAFGGQFPGDLGSRIAVGPGQWFAKADLVLWKPAAISGMVTGADGRPIAGADVETLARIYIAGRPHLAASGVTKTDDRGFYRLAGLLPAEYVVAVVRAESVVPASARDVYPLSFFPGTAALSAASPVTLTFGDDRNGVDVPLRLVPRSSVSGVARTAGRPAAGVKLDLVPDGEDLRGAIVLASTSADEEGRFSFPDVPGGSYTIEARPASGRLVLSSPLVSALEMPDAAGHEPGGSAASVASGPPYARVFSSTTSGSSSLSGHAEVTVGTDPIRNVELTLAASSAFHARIHVEDDAHVTSPPGLDALAFVMEPANGDPASGVRITKPNRVTGEVAFDNVLPGRYVFRLAGNSDWSIKTVQCNGQDVSDAPFEQNADRPCGETAIGVTNNVSTLTGDVVQQNGATADAVVLCFPSDKRQWIDYGLNPTRIREIRVKAGKTFRISGLPGGSYFLLAMPENRLESWKSPGFLQDAAAVAERVDLAWGQTASRTLRIRQPQ